VAELVLKNKRSVVSNADGANTMLATHVADLDYSVPMIQMAVCV